MFKSIKEIV